jgi:hypothetical protein
MSLKVTRSLSNARLFTSFSILVFVPAVMWIVMVMRIHHTDFHEPIDQKQQITLRRNLSVIPQISSDKKYGEVKAVTLSASQLSREDGNMATSGHRISETPTPPSSTDQALVQGSRKGDTDNENDDALYKTKTGKKSTIEEHEDGEHSDGDKTGSSRHKKRHSHRSASKKEGHRGKSHKKKGREAHNTPSGAAHYEDENHGHEDDAAHTTKSEHASPDKTVWPAPASKQVPSSVIAPDEDEGEPWPMYRIDTDYSSSPPINTPRSAQNSSQHPRWPWPGVGWNPYLSINDEAFSKTFKFYLYDEGPFDMREADKCWRKSRSIAPPDANNSMEELDSALRLNQREYFTELFLLPTLRQHTMRTLDKAEAKLFIIGYANPMARYAGEECVNEQYGKSPDEWDGRVAKALLDDAFFLRNKGRDFLFMHSLFKVDMSKALKEVLDSGPMIATFDRYVVVLL